MTLGLGAGGRKNADPSALKLRRGKNTEGRKCGETRRGIRGWLGCRERRQVVLESPGRGYGKSATASAASVLPLNCSLSCEGVRIENAADMESRFFRPALLFIVLLGQVWAGEWSHWSSVGGDFTSDRSANVVVRSRRVEEGDHPDRGFLFEYELHNQAGTQRAKVILYCPVQDPATRRWKEIDRNSPTIVQELAAMATVKGTIYSPSPRGFVFESDVKWPEELAAENERKAADKQPASSPENAASGSEFTEPQAEFEGVPIDTRKEGRDVLLNKMGYGIQDRFTVVIELFRPADDNGDGGVIDSSGNRLTWQEIMTGLLESYRNPEDYPDNLASFQILSSSRTAIKVRFSVVDAEKIRILLIGTAKPPARITRLVRLKSGG